MRKQETLRGNLDQQKDNMKKNFRSKIKLPRRLKKKIKNHLAWHPDVPHEYKKACILQADKKGYMVDYER